MGSCQALGWILTSIPGGTDLATQSCADNFGGAAPSNPIQDAVCYMGEGENAPLFLGCVAAHPNLELDMGNCLFQPKVWIALSYASIDKNYTWSLCLH